MEISLQKLVMQRTSVKAALAFLGFLFSLWGNAAELESFEAKYKAFRFGKELGHAAMQLEDLGRDKYKLTYNSKVSLFFLSDKRQEVSLFSVQDNKIVPYKYTFKRTGTGSNKSLEARFDEQTNLINLKDGEPMPWLGELDNQLYRLDLQLKLSQGISEFEYTLLNYRGQKRHYKLQVLGKEQLKLPYGMLEGIKVKIIRENKKRETYAWFSPELNYQLVRLQQFKEGDEQGDIQLSEFSAKGDSTTVASSN